MADDDTTRRQFIGAVTTATAIGLAGCGVGGGFETETGGDGTTVDDSVSEDDSMSEDDDMSEDSMSPSVTVTVRIENVAPTDFYASDSHTGGEIRITPGPYAVHTDRNPIYAAGEAATVGLEALAEAGRPTGFPDQPGLVDELAAIDGASVAASGAYTSERTVADPNDPDPMEGPGTPPIAPEGAFAFEVEAEPGQRLSFASMFVPSNDVFFAPGPDGIELWPEDGDPVEGDVTGGVDLWDAGTEPNGPPPGEGPDQAPAQDSPDRGDDEGGVVRRLAEVDDGHDYPAVEDAIRVTLSPDGTGNGGETWPRGRRIELDRPPA